MKFMNCSNLHGVEATYDIEGDKLEVEDKTIYMINDYGQLQSNQQRLEVDLKMKKQKKIKLS